MLRKLRDYENWNVSSSDAHDVGTVEDFYFDDERWTVRYLVIRTGSWLTGRSVLQSPMAIAGVRSELARFELHVTKDQIKDAPAVDLARPVSRQWEATYAGYYGFPPYWLSPSVWGLEAIPHETGRRHDPGESVPEASPDEQHLRSARGVAGYHIRARDGDIGHVDDFLVDDIWRIRYLTVDTSNWIGGRNVLIAAEWANGIDWAGRRVHLDVSRQVVQESPEYEAGGVIGHLDHRPVRLI